MGWFYIFVEWPEIAYNISCVELYNEKGKDDSNRLENIWTKPELVIYICNI